MMVTTRAFWVSVVLILLSVGATQAGTLSTSLAPSVGVGGDNTSNQCILLNVSTSAIKSVTIAEYAATFCEGATGNNPCHTVLKNTVTCADLQPNDFCNLYDDAVYYQESWCQFTVSGSSKNVSASMNVYDKTTAQTLAVLPATVIK